MTCGPSNYGCKTQTNLWNDVCAGPCILAHTQIKLSHKQGGGVRGKTRAVLAEASCGGRAGAYCSDLFFRRFDGRVSTANDIVMTAKFNGIVGSKFEVRSSNGEAGGAELGEAGLSSSAARGVGAVRRKEHSL